MNKSIFSPGKTGFKIYTIDEVNENSKDIIQIEPIKESFYTVQGIDTSKTIVCLYLCEVFIDKPHMDEKGD